MRLQQGKSCHCQIPLDSNRAVGDYIALSGVAIEARFATRACFERRGDASRRSLIWINIAKSQKFSAFSGNRCFSNIWHKLDVTGGRFYLIVEIQREIEAGRKWKRRDLKAYEDIGTENRPQVWSSWATFSIAPEAPSASAKPLARNIESEGSSDGRRKTA
ncbi:hypothetical protein ACVW1A_000558 [Bradyrhizobium sp. LB1.3]